MVTSGTYSFSPSLADLVLDAFERLQIRPAAITPDHMLSARRSANFLLVRWANNGINLWTVDEQTVILNEGQQTYNVPISTVTMLETWLRTYQMNAVQNVPPVLGTTLGSDEVEVNLPDHGLVVGLWVSIPIYVSIGGLIVQGNFKVTQVTNSNTFIIKVGKLATATVVTGGAVPVYSTLPLDDFVTVALDDHSLVGGDTFTVHQMTDVGGIALQGDFIVQAVLSPNTFTIKAQNPASFAQTLPENDGDMQIATQNVGAIPQDRILMPISRTDWAAIPNKTQQGNFPTVYWFDRTNPPTFKIWLAPTGDMVQEVRYFRMRQVQDADPVSGQQPEIPYRFEEAFAAGLAYMLAMKWSPESAPALKAYYEEIWAEATSEDRERVNLNIAPQTGSYYQ